MFDMFAASVNQMKEKWRSIDRLVKNKIEDDLTQKGVNLNGCQ